MRKKFNFTETKYIRKKESVIIFIKIEVLHQLPEYRCLIPVVKFYIHINANFISRYSMVLVKKLVKSLYFLFPHGINFPLPALLWCKPDALTADNGLVSGVLCIAVNVFFTASRIRDAVSFSVILRSGIEDLFRNQGCCSTYI